ncbi:MAG: BON domain-containing protein [Candidatus Binatus sp.]
MNLLKSKFVSAMLVYGLGAVSMLVGNARAQQGLPPSAVAPANAPVIATDKALNVEHDQVRTSAEHHYNSPAERANDDLLITEVKSSLAERGISGRHPVEVDCDHGTILLSGVVESADDAKEAEELALNTKGVLGVKSNLTWR